MKLVRLYVVHLDSEILAKVFLRESRWVDTMGLVLTKQCCTVDFAVGIITVGIALMIHADNNSKSMECNTLWEQHMQIPQQLLALRVLDIQLIWIHKIPLGLGLLHTHTINVTRTLPRNAKLIVLFSYRCYFLSELMIIIMFSHESAGRLGS